MRGSGPLAVVDFDAAYRSAVDEWTMWDNSSDVPVLLDRSRHS